MWEISAHSIPGKQVGSNNSINQFYSLRKTHVAVFFGKLLIVIFIIFNVLCLFLQGVNLTALVPSKKDKMFHSGESENFKSRKLEIKRFA